MDPKSAGSLTDRCIAFLHECMDELEALPRHEKPAHADLTVKVAKASHDIEMALLNPLGEAGRKALRKLNDKELAALKADFQAKGLMAKEMQ